MRSSDLDSIQAALSPGPPLRVDAAPIPDVIADALTSSDGDHASDADLLRKVANGDSAAFAAVYDKHGGILFGVLLRILRSRTDAEDVLQETFLQIWQRASNFDASRGRALSWLVLLARSRALDRLRSRGTRDRVTQEMTVEPGGSASEPSAAPAPNEDAHIVRRALSEIPESQREALELAYFEGLSQAEIAARLGKPLGTVKTHTRLGLMRLRDILGEGEEAS